MGNFSRDTFDPKKHYVGVRLQQGVLVLDADWNEQEDIRRHELETLLRAYVGNGVPQGIGGFKIQAVTEENDFLIKGGDDSEKGAGLCLADGWVVRIEGDVHYTEQDLFGKPDKAKEWKVEPLTELITPTEAEPRVYTVYLDVWEREVDHDQDPDLINAAIGVETCVRLKLEWVVRVAKGGLPAAESGHKHYELATLKREAGKPKIERRMIEDRRRIIVPLAGVEERLKTMEQRVLAPAFNPTPNQFSPKQGPPGESVRLFGWNFDVSGLSVRFGKEHADVVKVLSRTIVYVRVPQIDSGDVQITIQTSKGTTKSVDVFEVQPRDAKPPAFDQSPNQFKPKHGPPGEEVTLLGQNFNVSGLTVRFGDDPAEVVGEPTATPVMVRVPEMVAGRVKITVTTEDGEAISDDEFRVRDTS